MSAQNNLSQQLFHGTIETLKPGDIIRDREGGASWATSKLDYALKHTAERTRTGFGARPGGEYPVHHGNIYEVEPLGVLHEPEESKGTYASKEGFQVRRHVASVLGEEDNIRAIKRNFPSFDPSRESYVERGRERVFEGNK